MSREHHDWQAGKAPPLIRPHSLAKHRVLRAYLEQYVSILTANPRQEQLRLTLVDGFAGGGLYLDSRTKEERSGSPLIMLEAMEQAAQTAQQMRSKPFHLDVQYVFVEKDREALDYLRAVLRDSRFAPLLSDRIQLLHGEFVARSSEITEFVKNQGRANRAIYVLDQFGYSDVPLTTIRDVLATLENAEVLLTFATDFLIDYLSGNDQTQRILENVGITLPSKDIVTAKESRDWRRIIQFALHHEIPERTGAKFYTPFFHPVCRRPSRLLVDPSVGALSCARRHGRFTLEGEHIIRALRSIRIADAGVRSGVRCRLDRPAHAAGFLLR
ncbi:MAG: three-Cys-motif partner protein TcmP [Planctomycetaceae bacterium]